MRRQPVAPFGSGFCGPGEAAQAGRHTPTTPPPTRPQEKASSLSVPVSDPAAEEKRRRDAEEARQAELRAHGQPVTPEAFTAWKARFDAEQALERAKLEGKDAGEERKGRLTGKQWFLQQEAQHIEVRARALLGGGGGGAGGGLAACAWAAPAGVPCRVALCDCPPPAQPDIPAHLTPPPAPD